MTNSAPQPSQAQDCALFSTPPQDQLVAGAPGANISSLFEQLYKRLHKLAHREVYRQGLHGSISTTTLLHEAYLDMSSREGLRFDTDAQFLAYATRAMRGLVINRVRQDQAQKRGGGLDITSLNTEHASQSVPLEPLDQISQSLDELAQLEPQLAQLVDLKFFCGFSVAEIAAITESSERTVARQWEKARLLLHSSLRLS